MRLGILLGTILWILIIFGISKCSAAEISVGTISISKHYTSKETYNESHNGFYLVVVGGLNYDF